MTNLSKILLIAAAVLLSSMPIFAKINDAKVVEVCLVTEVLDWGETLTTIRIEYSEEIEARAFDMRTFVTSSPLNILYPYVNNTGKLDDAKPYGKYVFIKLSFALDAAASRELLAYGRERLPLAPIIVTQTRDVVTRQGSTVPAGKFSSSREIRTDIDPWIYKYRETVNGIDFGIALFVPEGYEKKSATLANLPLVVHYTNGNYAGIDYYGKRTGGLYQHEDATIFVNEKSQQKHPCFVVTLAASTVFPNMMYVLTHDELWAHESYYQAVKDIIAEYNIDVSRIYTVAFAGGTTMMWNTIIKYPTFFAAAMSTSFDFYMSYTDPDLSLANMKKVLDSCPNWFFCGLLDATGRDPLGDRRKGERLRDQAYLVNKDGYKIDVAYGEEGELMWNGMFRDKQADALAQEQIARAAAKGNTSFVTIFTPNTLKFSEHHSWVSAFNNSVVRDWMFAQSRKDVR